MSRSVIGSASGRTSANIPRGARVAVLALAFLLGCTDLFGPAPQAVRYLQPRLVALSFNDVDANLRHGGLLELYGSLADTALRLQEYERIPLEITATSGDSETMGFFNLLCPNRARIRGRHHCFRFDIVMQQGHDPSEVAPYLAAMGGRFNFTSGSWFAAVTIFETGNIVRNAHDAMSWPGVRFVELSRPLCLGSCPSLTVPVRIDTGAAIVSDGILQVRSADTITVSYGNPSGGPLRLQLLVP